jgi:hypothetical protein
MVSAKEGLTTTTTGKENLIGMEIETQTEIITEMSLGIRMEM